MADALIFEDDPQIGDLMSILLRGKGLSVGHFLSGAGAVQLVQEHRPRVVVLDIMMAGMDGLSVCRMLKSNPATKAAKIAVVTAKVYKEDREAAVRYGADAFLTKPFTAAAFEGAVAPLLGMRPGPLAPAPPAPPLLASVLPGSFVVEAPGLWLVFDAGAGLAAWLGRREGAPAAVWLLLSRFQRPAVADLAAGRALLERGARLNLAGPDDPDGSLQKLGPYVCASLPGGRRSLPMLYPMREGELSLTAGVRAACCYTQHPGPTLAYRVELQGRTIVYCPAHEVVPERVFSGGHELGKFRKLFEGADVLLHGFRRSQSETAPDDGHGRGAWEPVVDLAAASGVRELYLLPQGGQPQVDGLQARVDARVAEKGVRTVCRVSRLSERLVL